MKILKLIKIVIIVFIVVFLCLEVFVLTQGKAILSDNLKKLLAKEINIDSLYLTLPYSITINGLKIEDFLTVDKINLSPSISGLFFGKIGLNKLVVVKPVVYIIRTGNTEFNISPVLAELQKNQRKTGPQLSFIKEALIRSARMSFKDKTLGSSFDIMPIDISANTGLLDFKTRFNLDAQIVSKDGRSIGKAEAGGWLNFLKKDMDAKFSLNDVELVYFSPYFKDFFRKLKSGKLLFNADMVSKSNDLVVNCHLETHDLRFIEEPLILDNEGREINFLSTLSGLILNTAIGLSSGGIFDFSIHTKFDNPRWEGLQFKGNIFKEPIKNIIENPQETIEQFKKVGKDFEKIGKEFREQFKDIGDLFKKKSTSETQTTTDNTGNQQ